MTDPTPTAPVTTLPYPQPWDLLINEVDPQIDWGTTDTATICEIVLRAAERFGIVAAAAPPSPPALVSKDHKWIVELGRLAKEMYQHSAYQDDACKWEAVAGYIAATTEDIIAKSAVPPPPPPPDGLEVRVAKLEDTKAHVDYVASLEQRLDDYDAALAELWAFVRDMDTTFDEHLQSLADPTPPDPGPEVTSNSANSHSLRANTRTPPDPAPDDSPPNNWYNGIPFAGPGDLQMPDAEGNPVDDLDARRGRDDERLVVAGAEAEDSAVDGQLREWIAGTIGTYIHSDAESDECAAVIWSKVKSCLIPASPLVDSAMIRRLRIACEMHGHPVPSTGMAADILESTLVTAEPGGSDL